MEAIASALSTTHEAFNSVAVPFPTTIADAVLDNLALARTLYERQKEGLGTDNVVIPDYPQLRDLLTDLSYPTLWESMHESPDIDYRRIPRERGLEGKYHFDSPTESLGTVMSVLSNVYEPRVERLGLDFYRLKRVLSTIIR